MKALVLGATGHLGCALVRELVGRGYRVSGVTRHARLPPNLDGVPMRTVLGDDTEVDAFDRWVQGFDVVVDAAAPYGPSDPRAPDAASQKRRLTGAARRSRRLLDAVARSRTPLVYVGSFVTLREEPTSPTECAQHSARLLHPYFAAKEAISRQIEEATARGVPVVTVAPTACLGPWDYHRRHNGPIPLLLRGGLAISVNRLVNVVDVRDVARGAVAALEEGLFGESLLLAGHNTTLDTVVDRVCELAGRPRPRLTLPASALVPGALLLRPLADLFGTGSSQLLLGALLLEASSATPLGERQRQLGIHPRPLSQTLADAVAWYRALAPRRSAAFEHPGRHLGEERLAARLG